MTSTAGPAPQPTRARRAIEGVFDAAGWAAGACVFAILVLMIGGSIGRMAGMRVGAVNDIVAWLCAAAAFLAMAHAFKNGDFVRVTLLLEKVPAGTRRALEIVSLAIAAASTLYIAYWATAFTYESWKLDDVAQGMVAIRLWIPQASFVVGAVLFALAVVDELVIVLRGGVPTYVRRVAERHAEGDFSSDV